ncbi:hypothetical protein Gasu2_46830 [Galdieria sulphuraria]|uniref:Uncharacterized protein n=1 Tax=Galdieria sulphuraria TaxID=130081 RepID=M2W7A6_GALSU|nr:uncharacterized protein Gasu_10800 [Galdieria sulphuraria]EME31701.1 hypothetical protein Gasu_10800 [Galdieria sulphuraria]GJD10496.1 hypothetical protein Gasu2_46830 [Galdieria sulphuraria]|eukprot:XP_005708221.1 hypothetical protein Gasu_10800 [Galdieria sulphuraria]
MVLTRSSSKKAPAENEEKQEYIETPVRKLSRELASLGIRAPPGTPCQQSSPDLANSQVQKDESHKDQIAKRYEGSERTQLFCSLNEENNPQLCTTTLANRAAPENLNNNDALFQFEEISVKLTPNTQEPESSIEKDDVARSTELKDDDRKSLQTAEKQSQDSYSMFSTPVSQTAEASFQLLGNDASNEWCGEHVRFSILGKSKVKVYHQPTLKTTSPDENIEPQQLEENESIIEEDILEVAIPEPQKLDFDIHSEPIKSADNQKHSSPESETSYSLSSNETKGDDLRNQVVISTEPTESDPGAVLRSNNRFEKKESSETSKKKWHNGQRKCWVENSHFCRHTQSSAMKDKKFETNLQRNNENIDKSGNSIHWKGQHIRFEDSPDIIEEKMKGLHISNARFMRPTISTSAKKSEHRQHKQEFASKYLWKF